MHEHDHEIIDQLRRLDLGPEPPLDLDVAGARRTGSRIRRRRLAVTGTSALAVVAVAGLTATALAAGTSGTSGPAHPVGPATGPTAHKAAAVTRLDPLVQQADWGWVPDGLTTRITQVNPRVERLTATGSQLRRDGDTVPGTYAEVELTVAGSTTLHTMVTGSAPAPDVQGAHAVWITGLGPHNGMPAAGGPVTYPMLQWEWTPGGTATLWLNGPNAPRGDEGRQQVVRMAESLRLDARKPVRFPFTVTGLGALKPCQTTSYAAPGDPRPWTADLELARTDDCENGGAGYQALRLDVGRNGDRVGDDKIGHPNTVVDGHPAFRDRTADRDVLTVFDVDGHQITVDAQSAALLAVTGPASAVYADLRLVPHPDQPATWTTDPLR